MPWEDASSQDVFRHSEKKPRCALPRRVARTGIFAPKQAQLHGASIRAITSDGHPGRGRTTSDHTTNEWEGRPL